jgi:hypothetical protein
MNYCDAGKRCEANGKIRGRPPILPLRRDVFVREVTCTER